MGRSLLCHAFHQLLWGERRTSCQVMMEAEGRRMPRAQLRLVAFSGESDCCKHGKACTSRATHSHSLVILQSQQSQRSHRHGGDGRIHLHTDSIKIVTHGKSS
jgi:hypothetical protein